MKKKKSGDIQEQGFLGKGNSQCKGPVVGTSLEEGGGNSCGCSSLDKRRAAGGEKGEAQGLRQAGPC